MRLLLLRWLRDTVIHQGFDAFLDYIYRAQPTYFLHGHQHWREISYRGNTCIMGAYGENNLTLDLSMCSVKPRRSDTLFKVKGIYVHF